MENMKKELIFDNVSLDDFEKVMHAASHCDCIMFISEGVSVDNVLIYNNLLSVSIKGIESRKYIIFEAVSVNSQQSKLMMTLTDDDEKALNFVVNYEHAFIEVT